MNAQERQALQDFLQELMQARVKNKDHEADEMIYQAMQRQQDAPYLLVQRLLLQEQALNTAQAQIRSLQQQLQHVQQGQSKRFLDADYGWGRSGNVSGNVQRGYGQSHRDPRMHGGGHYSDSMMRPGLMNSGMGSFLGSMAGVAAGVAAGSFLFHGIDHLLHHDDDHGGANQQGLSDMSTAPTETDPLMGDVGAGDMAQDAGADDIGTWSDDAGMGDGDYA